MRISCITHVPFEGPEAIAEWAESRGFPLSIYHSWENKLPDPDSTDLLVVMGGPMGVSDRDSLPWLQKEYEWIQSWIQKGGGALGVCLGAQLLAGTLGGSVFRNEEKEIGWFPVERTPEAQEHPLVRGLDGHIPVFHWHGDAFRAPEGAISLFTNRVTECQGFLHESRILALQFHLESTMESVKKLLENAREDLTEGPYVCPERDILLDTEAFAQDSHEILFMILDRFVEDMPEVG